MQGRKLLQEHRATLAAIEQRFGVSGSDHSRDLGPRNRIWRLQAAARRGACAGDAGLSPDGARTCSSRNFLYRAEDAAGRRAARENALVMGRRDGTDAISAGGILRTRRRFRRRRPRRYLDVGAGCTGVSGKATRQQGLAARPATGRSRCARRNRSTAPSVCRKLPHRSATGCVPGFVPAYGRKLRADELAEPASLLQPAGLYGPSFLTTKNYFVIKEYNFSDLYVLFVGHLGDRISESRGRSRRHGARSFCSRPPTSNACRKG